MARVAGDRRGAGSATMGACWRAGLALLAVGAIAGAMTGGQGWWLHWVCKPAATLWVITALLRAPALPGRGGYRRWVLAGLCLSLLGDVLLMLPQGLFVPGLVAFALAHVCYIVAFAGGLAWPLALLPALGMVLLAGGNLLALWPHLPADMQLPVSVYVVLIGLMACLALTRWRRRLPGGGLTAGGALLFVLSDSLLAWDRFAGPLPAAIAGVLLTYWAAQALIAGSAAAGDGAAQ